MRDVIVFQGKLFIDGLKDIVLAPVSAVAAIAGLLFARKRPGRTFYEVLRMGRTFDRWINLFGALEGDSSDAVHGGSQTASGDGFDAYVRRLEAVLVEQHRRGGLTAKAKDAIDHALDALHGPSGKNVPSESTPGDQPRPFADAPRGDGTRQG